MANNIDDNKKGPPIIKGWGIFDDKELEFVRKKNFYSIFMQVFQQLAT